MANSLDLIICHPSLRYKGGAERAILGIAKKYSPVIYVADPRLESGYDEFREFDIRTLPGHPLERISSFFAGNERVSVSIRAGFRYMFHKFSEDYDVINAHVVPSEWIRNRNGRVCWYCHSPVRAAFDLHARQMGELGMIGKIAMEAALSAYKYGEFSVLPKIEKICTNSCVSNNRIRKYLHRDDAEIIYPAIDCKEFTCNGYGNFFFYPSRIIPEKRFEYAIDAFRKFSNGKNWKLVIGGALSDSKRDRDYFEKIRVLAAGSNVEFRLNMPDVDLHELYSGCYATLFTAIEEDFGLIPLESMASSKPCISVNEGGPRESIVDGKTGFLVNSPGEMAEKMRFLADHPGECEKMGKAGRKRVEQNYTWKIFLDKMDKALRETAKGKAED
ncbi:Trehalose synthase [uncultured archaeon]|nr:Trehalose synthase [uncultured archaeon]